MAIGSCTNLMSVASILPMMKIVFDLIRPDREVIRPYKERDSVSLMLNTLDLTFSSRQSFYFPNVTEVGNRNMEPYAVPYLHGPIVLGVPARDVSTGWPPEALRSGSDTLPKELQCGAMLLPFLSGSTMGPPIPWGGTCTLR